MITPQVRAAAEELARAAWARVADEQGLVRVEDYLTTLAAATGEAALVDSGLIDIEITDLTPGAAIFGDPSILTRDTADWAKVPTMSVVGILATELGEDVVSVRAVASLDRIYRHTALSVNENEWGTVATAAPGADHGTR